ncbi:MAG TPA: PIN domain-containing protein [Pyrinomonadaceae bacterium]|jgi:predicted nucleic acid-binding protein
MRILLDSDVVLDFVLERKPFVEAAGELFELIAEGACDGYISGITPVNVFYLTRKAKGVDKARQAISDLLIVFQVCAITPNVLEEAFALPFADYEDAVQHASAAAIGLDAIVTRNLSDYQNATLPVYSPTDFLNQLKAQP